MLSDNEVRFQSQCFRVKGSKRASDKAPIVRTVIKITVSNKVNIVGEQSNECLEIDDVQARVHSTPQEDGQDAR